MMGKQYNAMVYCKENDFYLIPLMEMIPVKAYWVSCAVLLSLSLQDTEIKICRQRLSARQLESAHTSSAGKLS